MTDLKTTFAGLSLRNPIIISSSGLTNSVGKNKKLAEDGAGAIVLKSLFEEQIMLAMIGMGHTFLLSFIKVRYSDNLCSRIYSSR